MQTRKVIDIFNHSYGLYADTWSAWAEGIINISVTIAAATQWGIIGILIGKLLSICFIVVIWKPYYLFTQGLKVPIKVYWSGTIRYYIAFVVPFALITILARYLPYNPAESLLQLAIYGSCTILPFVLIYFLLILFTTKGMLDVIKRLPLYNKIFK